jgi:ferredoxin-NADP reductase
LDTFIETLGEDKAFLGKIKPMQGVIDINHVWKKSGELNNPVFFLSGPPGMIQHFKKELLSRGTESTNIKIDEWE